MKIFFLLGEEKLLDIFEIKISQKEHEFAKAKFKIASRQFDSTLLGNKCTVKLIKDNQDIDLFQGMLINLPTALDNTFCELEAVSFGNMEKLYNLVENLKFAPFWNELFISAKDIDNPTEVLEARPAFFAWNRVNGEPQLTSIIRGENTIDLGASYLSKGLDITFDKIPLSQIDVTLSAEWLQSYTGYKNIRRSCVISDDMIESFDIKQHGHLHNIIYEIVHATALKESTSSFYEYSMCVQYKINQPRKEVLSFNLTQSVSKAFINNAKHRSIVINLQNLCPNAKNYPTWWPEEEYAIHSVVSLYGKTWKALRTHTATQSFDTQFWEELPNDNYIQHYAHSFFLTENGQKAIEHAVSIAKTHLIASARNVIVKFTTLLENAYMIDLTYSIKIRHPIDVNSFIYGKVIAYEFDITHAAKLVHITLGCFSSDDLIEAKDTAIEIVDVTKDPMDILENPSTLSIVDDEHNDDTDTIYLIDLASLPSVLCTYIQCKINKKI